MKSAMKNHMDHKRSHRRSPDKASNRRRSGSGSGSGSSGGKPEPKKAGHGLGGWGKAGEGDVFGTDAVDPKVRPLARTRIVGASCTVV